MLSQLTVYPTIPAQDLDRARDFYENTLGFSPVRDDEGGILYQAGNGSVFFLYQTPSAGTAAHTLMAWVTNDLDGTMRDLRERGVIFEEYDFPGLKTINGVADLGGEYAAWFKDTEGNILSVGQWT